MHQVEPWFSIVPRKRLRIGDFASKERLRTKLDQCSHEWHQHAQPFHRSTNSVAQVMAAAPAMAA
jgi:hypothetical protein